MQIENFPSLFNLLFQSKNHEDFDSIMSSFETICFSWQDIHFLPIEQVERLIEK